MATTEILALGTTNAYSSDIAVVAGTPMTVGAFVDGASGSSKALPLELSMPVEREATPGGQFIDTGFRLQTYVNDEGSGPNVTLVGAGVYRVRRISTQVGGVAVGVNLN